jgi:hypothetical protein
LVNYKYELDMGKHHTKYKLRNMCLFGLSRSKIYSNT